MVGERRRVVRRAGAGLMTAAATLVAGHGAAGATTTSASSQGSLTFTTLDREQATCTAELEASRDTDPVRASFYGSKTGGTSEACVFPVVVELVVSYKDQQGRTHQVFTTSDSYIGQTIDGAASNVRATLTVSYNECNTGPNGCSLTLTAAPK